jgi:hypothetical protein
MGGGSGSTQVNVITYEICPLTQVLRWQFDMMGCCLFELRRC